MKLYSNRLFTVILHGKDDEQHRNMRETFTTLARSPEKAIDKVYKYIDATDTDNYFAECYDRTKTTWERGGVFFLG